GYQGVGLSIPINQAKSIVAELLKDGKVIRGWMGVEIADVRDKPTPVQIQVLWKNGPADLAGLRVWDYLKSVDGVPVKDVNELKRQIAGIKPGTEVKVVVVRDGKEVTATLKIIGQPADLYKN
ncbi:MAG: S1C family serine protease, partial [Planctomycetota bacterium]